MKLTRVIPVLLMHDSGLVKSTRFKNYKYVGDPINAVKIFNEKEVDEIVLLDIDATREGRDPDISHIKQIAEEAFMPLAYGGGISTMDQIKRLFQSGVEKIILNYHAVKNPALITEASRWAGNQSIVVSVDVKRNILGKYRVYVRNGTENTGLDPVSYLQHAERAGAGEIFLNCIHKDGTYGGYDLEIIEMISKKLTVPLIACGGAATMNDFKDAINAGASAVAAGSMFVFQRPHNAVLISYPTQTELKKHLYNSTQ
jgi:imidazole glycerol-phosphate synthase subunit HisF